MARSIPAIVRLQGAIWPLHGAATVFGKPQAREVGFEAARQLTVVLHKKAKFHDSRAHSSTRCCWFLLGNNQG